MPVSVHSRLRALAAHLALLAAGFGLLPGSVAPAQAQRPLPSSNGPERPPQETEALQLLRRKLRPGMDYAGEQITELKDGRISKQRIRGDTRGHVRLEYLSPTHMEGDILLTAPEQFRNYHRRTGVIDIAFWPTGWSELEKRMMKAIRAGHLTVTRVGEELVAGRNAAIISVSASGPFARHPRGQAKFWIDLETGIQLKHEILNDRGLVSRTTMTRIVVGPESGVSPRDFAPNALPKAKLNPIFPTPQPPFATVQEAAGQLPFTPLEPTVVPPGFHLNGVWTFAPYEAKKRGFGSALLRYSDGVTTFTLFQRLISGRHGRSFSPPGLDRGNIQFWHTSTPNGKLQIVYIGHLPPAQVQSLRESLR